MNYRVAALHAHGVDITVICRTGAIPAAACPGCRLAEGDYDPCISCSAHFLHRGRDRSGASGGIIAYPLFFRRRCLTWGARPDEVSRKLPGDELLAEPGIVSTRAVWVDAPASSIWPWLVQMGPGRGGVYTYDWIEILFGLGMHSADVILPQYQDLQVGDAQRLGKRGPVLRVAVLEAERSLVLRSDDGNWVWAFSLVPEAAGTRLISRNRIATPGAPLPVRLLNELVMEPGSLIMERKMLLGIKQRAEDLAFSASPTAE